jgi:hypothetical protein
LPVAQFKPNHPGATDKTEMIAIDAIVTMIATGVTVTMIATGVTVMTIVIAMIATAMIDTVEMDTMAIRQPGIRVIETDSQPAPLMHSAARATTHSGPTIGRTEMTAIARHTGIAANINRPFVMLLYRVIARATSNMTTGGAMAGGVTAVGPGKLG